MRGSAHPAHSCRPAPRRIQYRAGTSFLLSAARHGGALICHRARQKPGPSRPDLRVTPSSREQTGVLNIPAYRFGGALLLCLGGNASDVWETMELFMLEMQGNIQIQK